MRREPRALFLGALLMLMLWGLSGASFGGRRAPGDAALESALRAEADRLHELALEARLSSVESGQITALIVGCEEAMAAGQVLQGVRRLAQAGFELERIRFEAEHQAIESHEELLGMSAEVLAAVPALSKAPRPAVIQALLEVAHGRARGYMTSAGVQGAQTRLSAGMYYLAVGRAYESQARFIVSLPFTAPAKPVQGLPGLEAYLDRLGVDITELYVPPISISRHPDFIKTSALLKLARQLFEEGAVLGALELALDTRIGLGRLQDQGGANLDLLQDALDEHVARVREGRVDHSLAALYLNRAELALSEAASGDSDRGQGQTAVLLEQVMPEYFTCFEATGDEPGEPAQVTVTLVRWPFT